MIIDDTLGFKGVFATPLYVGMSSKVATIQKEIKNALPDIEIAPTPSHWGRTHKLSQPRDKTKYVFDQDLIKDYNLTTLMKDIDDHLQIYCAHFALNYAPDYQRKSWMAVFDEHEHGHIHNHYDATVSGCYYFATDGSDGNIFFPPCGPTKTMGEYVSVNQSHGIKATVGKIVMFPGTLEHGITTNTTTNRRISISFNLIFKRF